MFRGNVLVLEVRGLAKCLVQHLIERLAHAGLRGGSGHTRQFLLDLVQVVLQPLGRNANLFEHGGNHALAILDQRQQQMHRQHFGVAELACPRLRLLHRLL
jgi:hypothetical protein